MLDNELASVENKIIFNRYMHISLFCLVLGLTGMTVKAVLSRQLSL